MTQRILCVATSKGSVHDFKMYKNSIGSAISNDKKVLADSGYQGIYKFHLNSYIPNKKSKNHVLTDTEIYDNRKISKERILIENINAKIKVFKILSNKYRNRRQRFGLRMSLFCGVINFELSV